MRDSPYTVTAPRAKIANTNFIAVLMALSGRDNGNVHRAWAAANILQAEKAAWPAAPCATYCYSACHGASCDQAPSIRNHVADRCDSSNHRS